MGLSRDISDSNSVISQKDEVLLCIAWLVVSYRIVNCGIFSGKFR